MAASKHHRFKRQIGFFLTTDRLTCSSMAHCIRALSLHVLSPGMRLIHMGKAEPRQGHTLWPNKSRILSMP